MIKALQHFRSVSLVGALLLSTCAPMLCAQTAPAKQGCAGSTVDDLGNEDIARKSRAFLAELQAAVSKGDKAKAAAMISYPLLVTHDSAKTRIRTKAQFLTQYDSIFDAHVRQAIVQQSAKCLFGNWQGTMIGDGEVWYQDKIVTVNVTAGNH